MTLFKTRVSAIASVLGVLLTLPLDASQGRGGGAPPPPLPPAPVTVVNPTAVDCYSGPGCLDPALGTLGKVQHDVGGAIQNMSAMATQPDGRIVAAGTRQMGTTLPADYSWVIGRFLGDGTIDATFGAGGIVSLNLIPGDSSEFLLGVAVQADGKIVAAGSASAAGSALSTVVIRLSDSGVLDPTFGSGGQVMLSSGGTSGGLVLQPDGKILIAESDIGGSTRVTRLQANGAIDKKFGSQGYRLILDMAPNAVALQSTGSIVVAGRKSSIGDGMLARLTSSGALDTSFGSGGAIAVDFSGQTDGFIDVSIASDDSIAAGGYASFVTTIATMNLAIARFTANGALAPGFGSSGRVVFDIHGGWDQVRAIKLRTDGRVEFAGWAGLSVTNGFPVNIVVGRLTTTGALDSSFGSGGVTETANGVSAEAVAAAVGPDGLLTVGGHVYNVTTNSPDRWQLSRYFR